MPRRILIDAAHPEETRVVLLENGRVQELDSETSIKRQLKGNIYLAKVTRVEPSLQAAFVDYGEDKHGFLSFTEIHPDYYQIPSADKQELLKALRDEESRRSNDYEKNIANDSKAKGKDDDDAFEQENPGDEMDEIQEDFSFVDRQSDLYRRYKIQEVIKRNQIILVQVEKEERGNKGASLTSFISLAGRYCVLMPNAVRKGGISRRIDNAEDRKRLKTVIEDLNLSEDASVIVRTAGYKRAGKDIKADYNYLVTIWNSIREKTLSSRAPAFIYSEADIIKRTLRDLYNDIDELLIEGQEAFGTAKDFVKEVMPSDVSNVKQYKNKVPIFSRYKVEEQIAALYESSASLESGGYIVINPTEALISIDVNSGKSTSQRNVEQTALKTNMEATKEIARQLRLRNLSGLIVVDFIDMLDVRNRKAVERALKDAFQEDRAKVQIGRISIFGLLEMSRQRLNPSFLEINTVDCEACKGIGFVKATESIAVMILRAVEAEATRGSPSGAISVHCSFDVASYLFNRKRNDILEIEDLHNAKILVFPAYELKYDDFRIEKVKGDGFENAKEAESLESGKRAKREKKESSGRSSSFNKRRDKNSDKKPSRRGHKNTPSDNDTSHSSPDSQGLLEGLWKKIVE